MCSRNSVIIFILCSICPGLIPAGVLGRESDEASKPPSKVYVPYEELKDVFEKEEQGVFLPYQEFQKLWRAAQARPADVGEAPFAYLISTAKFAGGVREELATIRLELTIDILGDGWVQVPLGLGEVAVSEATLVETPKNKTVPLLRVVNGEYVFITKGKGRYVLGLDFVRQLETQPGLAVLKYKIPSAAITTLELLIPEENLKVDVKPLLAASTSQVEVQGTKSTRLQAFLGSTKEVQLSWKPKTETAAELEPVITCEQYQHINVGEALISYEVKLDYNIHRGGVNSFTVKLPSEFRVTDVAGANIAKWDIEAAEAAGTAASQTLKVQLFSAAKDKYSLTVKLERFLQEAQAKVPLKPITTEQALRQSGLIGITYTPRRSVHLEQIRNLARVDTGQLAKELRTRHGVTAYRFITADYSSTIVVETTSPRITVNQQWMLGVDSDRLELRGRLRYKVERTGIFELSMHLPQQWEIESVGPQELVDDYQLKGTGDDRRLHILLRQEKAGEFELRLIARADRTQPEGIVDFALPLADAKDLQLYQGQLMLLLADQLQAEVDEVRQLQAISLRDADKWGGIAGLSPAMAFEFRAIDRQQTGGGKFRISLKPVQISATVHRLVNIQTGAIDQEAVIQYRIRYAPLDTFYLKMPAELADAGAEIIGADIKEKPRIDELPSDQRTEQSEEDDIEWAYYKVVLQSKVTGRYELIVRVHQPFKAGEAGKMATVRVEPILAAGKLSDQNGRIAIAKAETLAIGEPETVNLTPADASSSADLPYQPHRRTASLAFKYNAPPFELTLPVVVQQEAVVFTTIVSGAIIEQVLARDGILNTHATYLLATSQGDRIPITLPKGAELMAVLLNGDEAPVEMGVSGDERIVRLPPSAGQVSRFVLEVTYGLKDASARNLTAPALPKEIPVQQTLWRLWIPQDHYLLGYDRIFSLIDGYRIGHILEVLRRGQPSQVEFKLPAQGRVCDFIRQGAPGELSVLIAKKEVFNIIIWIIVVAAGAAMLKLEWFVRVVVLLAAGLVAGIVHLFVPLFIERALLAAGFAGCIVLLLWIAQWVFVTVPGLRGRGAGKKAAAAEKKQPEEKAAGQNTGKGGESQPSSEGQEQQ